jgi:D-beta-D-heptose 7-phosphate kinase/D-beta-D-heptose 1-phosphate adenosyltransferase
MLGFEDILSRIEAQTVLCVGDLMLDEFVYGDVSRISPEAATPVLAAKRHEVEIGGAGNVARNIAGLGARCIFVGVLGDDDAGRALAGALARNTGTEPHLVVDPSRPTTHKLRFVSEHHSTHMLRADWEFAGAVSAEIEAAILAQALPAIDEVGAVVLSDYAKGVLTPRVVRALIEAAVAAGKPVVVDPKGTDYPLYRGTTLITPIRKELAEAVRRPAVSDAEIEQAAAELSQVVESEAVLVKRSEDGMSLIVREGACVHVPAYPVRVRDVSGAGDTVAAVLGALLAMGADFEAAMRAANAAAAVVVGKRGTAALSLAELRARLLPQAPRGVAQKVVFDWRVLDDHLAEWGRSAMRVGFTNGCFDLLHPGHIKLLTEARAACDRLVVGLNSDVSVRGLKGEGRPLQNQQARAEVLAALEAVDLVVIFDQPTPLELIRHIRPKVLVKGSDYRREEVVGHEVVEAAGGEVMLVDLLPGHSTTRLVRHSQRQPA